MWIFTPGPLRFIIIIKIINITHSAYALLTLKTDTMYLSGFKSIVRVFLFFSAVEFYIGVRNADTVPVYAFNRK
jgi:hypothetical protein